MGVWGSDFRFVHAQSWFGNMSIITNWINNNPEKYGINIRYATVSEVCRCGDLAPRG